jgi:hypothetical protein
MQAAAILTSVRLLFLQDEYLLSLPIFLRPRPFGETWWVNAQANSGDYIYRVSQNSLYRDGEVFNCDYFHLRPDFYFQHVVTLWLH